MSEPDYRLDLDKERISTLEAMQEDTFYSTDTFISMMGDLETGRAIAYIGANDSDCAWLGGRQGRPRAH